MPKPKLAPGASTRPLDQLRTKNLDQHLANKLRSLLGTCRFLLLEGPGAVSFGRWLGEQDEAITKTAGDFIHDLTTVAISAQKVLDALESRLNADESTG
jgi:hypothetical protein